VLNAFRHLRTNHPARIVTTQQRVQCSTPFGICGRITFSKPGCRSRSQSVLNAFRHLRTNHESAFFDVLTCCDVLNAFRHLRTNHLAWPIVSVRWMRCAQRLSASADESQARGGAPGQRHLRAQRLSASADESHVNSP